MADLNVGGIIAWMEAMFNAGTNPFATNVYLSLHTADPGLGVAAVQTTNEAAYPGYARVALTTADASIFDVNATTGLVTLKATQSFPAATGATTEVISHLAIGADATGGGVIIAREALLDSGGTPTTYTMSNGSNIDIIHGASGLRLQLA